MVKVFTGRIILVRLVMMAAMVALIGIGIGAIYSAGNPDPAEATGRSLVSAGAWQKQLIYAMAGLGALIMINLVNYRRLGPASYWMYPAILLVLAVVLLGKVINITFVPRVPKGSSTCRWLQLIPGQCRERLTSYPSDWPSWKPPCNKPGSFSKNFRHGWANCRLLPAP